jgi:hypothetical protein
LELLLDHRQLMPEGLTFLMCQTRVNGVCVVVAWVAMRGVVWDAAVRVRVFGTRRQIKAVLRSVASDSGLVHPVA